MSTITTINATDKPRLSREVINTNFANLNASKAEIADVALLAGAYANPSWITSLAWAKITGAPATYAPSSHTHPFTEITGSIANAQVPQSAVTQHQASLALAASQITSGALALARGGTGADLSATGGANQVLKQASAGGVVTVAALVAADIPSLDTAKITTGTFADARIAASNVTQHQAALTIAQSQVTSLTTDIAAKVGGASSLTTAGAVPYVSSAGVLGQSLALSVTGGTVTVNDPTLSTGATLFVVRGGAADGSATPLIQVKGNDGTVKAGVTAIGLIFAGGTSYSSSQVNLAGSLGAVELASTRKIAWSNSSTNPDGTADLALSRNGAGVLEVNSGAAGTYRDLIVRALNTNGTALGVGSSNTAPTGTLSALDRTAVTGATDVFLGTDGTNTSATSTRLVIRLGQGQSTVKPFDVQSNAGSSLAYVAADGSGTFAGLTSPSLTYAGTLGLSATGANVITLSTNGSERARVSSGGLFGIATASPLARLSVGDGSLSDGNFPVQISAGGTRAYYAVNRSDGNYGAGFGWDTSYGGVVVRSINASDDISLVTNSTTRAVTVKSGGNLLVGTATDDGASKLQVAGTATAYSATVYNPTAVTGSSSLVVRAGAGQSTNKLLDVQNNSGNSLAYIGSNGSIFSTDGTAAVAMTAATGYGYLGTTSAHDQVFVTGGTERVRIINSDPGVKFATTTKIGFFGVAPVARAAALTAANAGTLNTGDAPSDTIIGNMRTRIAELESKLQAYGLLN